MVRTSALYIMLFAGSLRSWANGPFSTIASTFYIKLRFTSDVVVVGIDNAGHIWCAGVAFFYGILVKELLQL